MTTQPHPTDVHVGERIRTRRRLMAQSQTELAAAAGISFQQIQKYEKGSNRVSCSKLAMIARAQGTTPAYYFEGLDFATEAGAVPPERQAALDWLQTGDAARLAIALGAIESNKDAAFVVWLAITAARQIAEGQEKAAAA